MSRGELRFLVLMTVIGVCYLSVIGVLLVLIVGGLE